jgi:hypothetical protein
MAFEPPSGITYVSSSGERGHARVALAGTPRA